MIEGLVGKGRVVEVVQFQSFCVARSRVGGTGVFQGRQFELSGVRANGNLTWEGTGKSIAQADQD